MPVFIGDDVTDEEVFAVMPELGGKGFSVGRIYRAGGDFDPPWKCAGAVQRLASVGQARRS